MATKAGKTALVTGANAGIGLATAIGLAQRGFAVILVARDRERGEAAQAEVSAAATGGQPTLLLADLSVQAEVRRLAEQVLEQTPRLDVLVNNAALIPAQREVSRDGIEMQLAVNHLAPFLLTNLLLPALLAAAPSRIVTVASQAHGRGRIDFDDLEHERAYHIPGYPVAGWQAYANTKLMNVLFTNELARRLAGTGVTANSLHPGVIATNLTRTWPQWARALYKLVMPTPERGAQTSLYLATSPEVDGVSGRYFDDKQRVVDPAAAARDTALAERLWQVSASYTGIAPTMPQDLLAALKPATRPTMTHRAVA